MSIETLNEFKHQFMNKICILKNIVKKVIIKFRNFIHVIDLQEKMRKYCNENIL